MNRLSPWLVRRLGPARLPAAAVVATAEAFAAAGPPQWLDDVRLFLTGWAGGLVFFGTLIG